MGDAGIGVECHFGKLKTDGGARADAVKADLEVMILGAKPVEQNGYMSNEGLDGLCVVCGQSGMGTTRVIGQKDPNPLSYGSFQMKVCCRRRREQSRW